MARFRRLNRDSRALLESLVDRLRPERVERLRHLSDVGEWGLLVNGLCASLVTQQIPITLAEREALAAVLALFPTTTTPGRGYDFVDDPDGTLAALNVA
jgi:hypothetical protein